MCRNLLIVSLRPRGRYHVLGSLRLARVVIRTHLCRKRKEGLLLGGSEERRRLGRMTFSGLVQNHLTGSDSGETTTSSRTRKRDLFFRERVRSGRFYEHQDLST